MYKEYLVPNCTSLTWNGGSGFRLEPIFVNDSASLENVAHFKSDLRLTKVEAKWLRYFVLGNLVVKPAFFYFLDFVALV